MGYPRWYMAGIPTVVYGRDTHHGIYLPIHPGYTTIPTWSIPGMCTVASASSSEALGSGFSLIYQKERE